MSLLLLSSITIFAQQSDDHNGNRDNRRNNNAQNYNPPDNIQQSFQRDNPEVKNAQWQNSRGRWHTTYKDKDNRDADAYYDNDGNRLATHYAYNQTDLPEGVRRRLEKRHETGYQAYRIERPNSGVLFQITFSNGNVTYYDENGKKRKYRE